MADSSRLSAALASIDKVDRKKLERPQLGEESLAGEFEGRFDTLQKLRNLIEEYAPFVHKNHVDRACGTLEGIGAVLANHCKLGNSEWIAQRNAIQEQFDQHLADLREPLPAFVAAAVVERGLLRDEDFRREHERAVEAIKKQAEATLAHVETESKRILGEAQKIAEEIEKKARRTATGISVQEAQKQFKQAQKGFTTAAIWWGGLLRLLSAAS